MGQPFPPSPTSPLKRPFASLEHSVIQFNDVLIPHRLDMLKKHKNNIDKCLQMKDYSGASKEQAVAAILMQNISRDLIDIEALRAQVKDVDRLQFDRAIVSSKEKALHAIQEFVYNKHVGSLGKQSQNGEDDDEDDDSGYIASQNILKDTPPLMLRKSKSEILTQDEEAYIRSCERLQADLEDLNAIFVNLNKIVEDQDELIGNVEENVNVANEEVLAGNRSLRLAVKYKATLYPVVGAALGTLIGGPIGLLVGLKTGAGLAVGGSLMGYVGGKLMKKKINCHAKSEDKEFVCSSDNTPDKNYSSTSVVKRR